MKTTTTMIRWAQQADVSDILVLFEKPEIRSTMRRRSKACIQTLVDQSQAVVMVEKDDDGSSLGDHDKIVGYGEAILLASREDIVNFAWQHNWATYRYQDQDALLYLSGCVTDGRPRGFAAQLFGFLSEELFREDKILRMVWKTASPSPQRPRRVIASACSMTSDGAGIQLLKKMAPTLIDAQPSLYHQISNVSARDGTNRTGYLMLIYLDRPLTTHQEQRTQRNRYLITHEEQRRLLSTRIGIVGLSTGSVVLEALLRAGIGGIYRLADYDVFETSNSNRMLFGAEHVGKPKLELCSERIRSVDPSLVVEPFPQGLNTKNVYNFVEDCDIIVEECDDFPVKMMIRQAAQKAKVPVIMGTSQNGMIDVERYDIDPDCQPFFQRHSLSSKPSHTASTESSTSNGSNQVEAPLEKKLDRKSALNLFDVNQISDRFLVSFGEVGRTISSWPQLSEEVFLNAATVTHACRRILLGEASIVSGRFSIRMDQLLTPYNRCMTQTPPVDLMRQGLAPLPRFPFAWDNNLEQSIKQVMFVDYWVRTAPSGGNQQFWQTRLVLDTATNKAEADFFKQVTLEFYWRQRGLMRGFSEDKKEMVEWTLGAMMECAEIAAAHLRLGVVYSATVDTSEESNTVARLHLTRDENKRSKLINKSRLFPALALRSSVRTSGSWTGDLPAGLMDRLAALGVTLVQDPEGLNKICRAILTTLDARFADPKQRHALFDEISATVTTIHPKLLGFSVDEENSIEVLKSKRQALDFMVSNGLHREAILGGLKNALEDIRYFFVACDVANDATMNKSTYSNPATSNNATAKSLRKGRLMQLAWLEMALAGVGTRPFSLQAEHRAMLDIPHAFFVWAAVQPDQLGLCSSRL